MDMDFQSANIAYVQFVKHDGNYSNKKYQQVQLVKEDGKNIFHLNLALKRYPTGKSAAVKVNGSSVKNRDAGININSSYNEENLISGNNIMEKIANVSQNDSLNDTINDKYRCGAGSLINAYLLMGGNFEKAAVKFNVGSDLTYKNLHLLQERLYNYANHDGKIGLVSSYKYLFNNDGLIYQSSPMGEVYQAAAKLDMQITPLLGTSVKTIHQKKAAVEKYFQKNPKGALQVSVHLNFKTGQITGNSPLGQNHYVAVFKENNRFLLADTGRQYNGRGKNIRELASGEVDSILYNTNGIVSALSIKDNNDTLYARN